MTNDEIRARLNALDLERRAANKAFLQQAHALRAQLTDEPALELAPLPEPELKLELDLEPVEQVPTLAEYVAGGYPADTYERTFGGKAPNTSPGVPASDLVHRTINRPPTPVTHAKALSETATSEDPKAE